MGIDKKTGLTKLQFLIQALIVFTSLTLYNVRAEGMPALSGNDLVKIAEQFEKLLFSASPEAKGFISFIDISSRDRHLIVYIKDRMLQSDNARQNNVYKSILELWRDTQYVKEKQCANWIEIRYQDIMTGETRSIKTLK